MVSLNFQKRFSCFGIKFGVSHYIKKKNFLSKKMLIHGKCMTSIFLMATTKFFQSVFEIAHKNLCVFFFHSRIDFRTQTNIFSKKKFSCKIFFLYNIVLETLMLDFF